MAGVTRRIVFLTPTYKPVGGVVKIMDYVTHARHLGFAAAIHCPDPFDAGLPLFRIDRFGAVLDDPDVTFHEGFRFGLEAHDYAFFSWPGHHDHVSPRITPDHHPLQTIAIVQNVRWANPRFAGGHAVRVLGRPMARIMVTHEVDEAVAHLVDRRTPSHVIVEGHDWPFFSLSRQDPLPTPMRIGYTTWKSDVGIAVEKRLSSDPRFTFTSVRETVEWRDLRSLYHGIDVFLGCPGPEEGFYLPGLEAMAGGNIVVMPDVGGNRSYGRFGENCIEVPFEDAEATVAALADIAGWDDDRVRTMRAAGYAVLENHRLERERDEFGALLTELDEMIAADRAGITLPG
jgi:hypothetical protein